MQSRCVIQCVQRDKNGPVMIILWFQAVYLLAEVEHNVAVVEMHSSLGSGVSDSGKTERYLRKLCWRVCCVQVPGSCCCMSSRQAQVLNARR